MIEVSIVFKFDTEELGQLCIKTVTDLYLAIKPKLKESD